VLLAELSEAEVDTLIDLLHRMSRQLEKVNALEP